MSAQAQSEQMSWAGTQAIVEGAKAQARKRTVLVNEQRLSDEMTQLMGDIELRVAPELLQAHTLRSISCLFLGLRPYTKTSGPREMNWGSASQRNLFAIA
eukprot:2180162-Pleurochrysis_carterae.AAC.1